MYTRCPHCQTVFRLTAAQLKARGGQVRCGRCQQVFQADQHLVDRPAKSSTKAAPGATRKRTRKTARPEVAPAAHVARAEPAAAEPAGTSAETAPAKPAVAPLLRPARVRTRTLYWTAGSALFALLLIVQGLVFYAGDLVRAAPVLRGAVAVLCGVLPCRLRPSIDMRRLDLVETQVTPHPRYDRALRIQATIVNRADVAQPYPLLEVSLIDSQGQLVARRAYPPREYLRKPQDIDAGLPPQVAVSVQLDITSPGPQASGYEILLLPPGE